MSTNETNSTGRIDEIEGLRGIAIIFTLFHHVPLSLFVVPTQFLVDLYSHFTFWGGVDLFFAISGFVIMRSFARSERITESFWKKAKKFWIRRCFRIFPPAWIWLGIFLILSAFVNSSGAFGGLEQNLEDAIPAVLQYANIHEAFSNDVGTNNIYWSLSLEEQFYFLLPIFVFIFRRKLPFVLVAAGIVQFFFTRPEWSLGWAVRTDALIWGVLIAIFAESSIYKKIEPLFFRKHWEAGAVTLLFGVAGIAFLPAKLNQISIGTGLVALISAVLVWIASYNEGYLFNWGFAKRLLMWFGTRSYSLYLIHILAYRFSHEIFYQLSPVGYTPADADSYILAAIAFPLLAIAAELSYRFIEQPFRNLGRKLSSEG